ncbi:uncharacterized protein LOC126170199 [Schistocerca cancellata]|uniref:uncharacterized protein LOC126170199 n=1 Tax=Schistocerca cancellata TaxID=274614 RepID=UPI002117F8FF|nr:uncharacterized protein LOC126170199 [Schistocerca cancellata]XP_049776661.1 uncharacterized protein LOC126170199 [Schistocerca cancellata]XP_049776662.1 uncharacterized protein LOC126170199 [Schistocerca cancellata]
MSYRETTEDLETLVGKLTTLITDTFKCCVRNYEALLPYLGKKETNSKTRHKLVQVNILLNKLNEDLVSLRVEYAGNSSYEQKGKSVLCEGGRKRRMNDLLELGGHETKNIKMKVQFTNNTKHSIALTSETGISMQSEDIVLTDSEETSNTQNQKSDIHRKKNTKMEIQDSKEVKDTHELPITNSQIHAVQKSCDTTNNEKTVCFADDEESESVPDRVVKGNTYDKSADSTIHTESNEACVPLQNVESEISSQETCEDSDMVLSKDPITCVPVQRVEKVCNVRHELYGIKKHKKNSFKCTLCMCVVSNTKTLYSHVQGKKHQKKLAGKACWIRIAEVPNNTSESAASVSVCSTVACSLTDTVPSNSCESIVSDSVCSAVSCSPAEIGPSSSSESTASDSVSPVFCSLADNVAIVEDKDKVASMKRAVVLEHIWTYFDPPFHFNKKFIRFHSGRIICYLCYEETGRYILDVRKHISKVSHLDRINTLRNMNLKNKSSNILMFDVPGSLKNIVPATQFSLRNYGFFCTVCNCFCENTVVLNHMTSESHGKKLDEIQKSV